MFIENEAHEVMSERKNMQRETDKYKSSFANSICNISKDEIFDVLKVQVENNFVTLDVKDSNKKSFLDKIKHMLRRIFSVL